MIRILKLILFLLILGYVFLFMWALYDLEGAVGFYTLLIYGVILMVATYILAKAFP